MQNELNNRLYSSAIWCGARYMKNILPFMLLWSANSIAGEWNACSYLGKNNADMITEKDCIQIEAKNVSDSDASISQAVTSTAQYDENGVGYLYSPLGIYYFTRAGRVRKTISYDNGPDYFKEGMARTERNGKIGYFNTSLNIVVEPAFDFAMPFQNGVAMVCNGCKQKKVGEHSELVGGFWGVIDSKGMIIEPIDKTMTQLLDKMPEIPAPNGK